MKRYLFGLTLLGVSGSLLAQSSVTLYGVADAGVGKIKSGEGSNKVHMTSTGLMNNSDSLIGVEGVEDLGGGLQAGFNFETALSLNDGAADDPFWGSQAHMWLGGAWGTLTLGRTEHRSTPGILAWELTDDANYSVVNNTYGYIDGLEGDSAVDSQFSYTTPEFAGLTAEVGYVFKDDNGSATRWDGNLVYENGPISAGVSANKVKDEKTGYALGGKYSLGQFAVAASYSDNRSLRRGFSLGGTAEFGLASLTLDLTRDTKNTLGKKYTNGLLEGKYALSKRTFLYAAYLRLDGDNNYGVGLQHNF